MAPSDANGNYSLPDGYLAETGQTILASQHNPPLEDLGESMTQRIMASGAKPFTGPAKFADGAVGAPGLTFNTATSSGVYKTADGIGFAIGGVKAAELIVGGFKTGAKYIGELFDWTGTTAPSLCVLPYGQTLSRTTYADLWAFAQIEIAAGNTFYNNGNGSTTFGIGDCRGRVRAAWDSMGGSSGNRLTNQSGGLNGDTIGAAGGAETHTLITAELAAHTHSNSLNDPGHFHGIVGSSGAGGGIAAVNGAAGAVGQDNRTTTVTTGMTITNASAGSGSAHNNVQPTIITNCALFAGA